MTAIFCSPAEAKTTEKASCSSAAWAPAPFDGPAEATAAADTPNFSSKTFTSS